MYYYNDGENEVGPFSLDKLKILGENGLIGKGTLVRDANSNTWIPLDQITGNERAETRDNVRASNDYVDNDHHDSLTIVPTKHESAPNLDGRSASTQTIEEDIVETGDPKPTQHVSALGWLAHPPTPWRRYGARIFDTTFNGAIGFFLFGIAFYAIAPHSADLFFSAFESGIGRIFDAVMTAIFASIIGGAMIGVTGLTLGKLIFGVKITRLDGGKPGLAAGWARDFSVLLQGMGLGIPLVALFTMWFSYKTLTDSGSTSWDTGRYIVWHRPSGAAQYILNFVGIALILLLVGLLTGLG